MIFLIQNFEADFLWKVSLKILNSEIILKTFTHAFLLVNVSSILRVNECLYGSSRTHFKDISSLWWMRFTLRGPFS